MNRSFFRCVLIIGAFVSNSLAAPPTIELPKASWEPIYFRAIDAASKKAAWIPLRQVDLPDDSIEIRVWIGFGLGPLRGILLRREKSHWSGFDVIDELPKKPLVRIRQLRPKSGWDALWMKLNKFDITTLPDSYTLPQKFILLDGISYVVEINNGKKYRTYEYGEPEIQEWPEAKNITAIGKLLNEELIPQE